MTHMLAVKLRGIPSDWSIIPLIDLCTGKPEYGANVSSIEYREDFPRYVRITDISEEGVLLENDRKSIRPDNAESYLLRDGDIVFARSGATVGKTYLYRERDGICAFAGYLIRFQPDPSRLHPGFLFHITHSPIYYYWVQRVARHTAQPNINAKEYSKLSIPVPPVREQERIVELLDTIDTLILISKESMAYFQKIKKGLMQRLLTRGIGHTKFKKTKIGEIPESWEIRALGELSKINARSLNDKTDSESEIEYIEIASIEDPGYIGHTSRMRYSEAPSRARRIVRKGDVIVSTVRPYLKAIALIRQDSDNLVASTGFAVLTPLKNLDSEFLLQSVFSEYFMAYLTRRMVGSNYPAVTAKDIEQYQLACPPEKEQRRIASILRIVDEKMETERKYCIELECLKKGLMQVLLTGKVRVKV